MKRTVLFTVLMSAIPGLVLATTPPAAGGPPANDLCTDVTPEALTVGASLTFTGDNTNATFTGDAEPGNVMSQFPSPNTWHAFTTDACSNVTVSYCGTAAGWSNVWKLLSVDCPADSLINASTSDNTTCPNGNWTFTFNALAAGTYYLPVPNVGFGQGGGPYSIEVTATACTTPPGTDHCGDAVPQDLAVGGSLTFTGDNTGATFDGDAVPGNVMSQFPFANTWHAFTTDACSNVTVSYCGTASGWTNVWKLLSVDCPADSLINASTSDNTTCPNGNWTFTFNALAAGTYYLPVPNVGFGQGGGPYSIEVTATACATPPGTDHCGDAVPQDLAVGGSLTFTGDNTGATFDGDAVPGNVMSQFPFANTWHAFTTDACSNVTVSYCATDSGWSNVWKLLAVTCPADSLINASASDTSTCANNNWTFTFNELPAGTYYLPVPNVGFGQGGGAYTIEVTATACATPPGTDHCGDAVPQDLAVGGSLTFTGDNTGATFDGDAVPGNVMSQFPFANTWHAFTTDACSNVTVSYCATDSGWSNVWKLLAVTCPADSLINASGSDTSTCANNNWTFTFNELAAGTYYLPVPNVGFGQGGGAYTISVTSTACTGGPPANDLCTDVTPVALEVDGTLTFTGDNTHATFAGDAVDGTLMATYPSPNTWHAFTTSTCADVTVSYCATDSGWSNVWKLLTRYCPADSLINASVADTSTCANGNWTFTFDELPAGTYYLPVPNVGFGQGGGPYTVNVSAAACGTSSISTAANGAAAWLLYPNPTTGELTISRIQGQGTATLELVDMTGRILVSQMVELRTGHDLHLDLSGRVQPGAYLLRLSTRNGRLAQRIVIN